VRRLSRGSFCVAVGLRPKFVGRRLRCHRRLQHEHHFVLQVRSNTHPFWGWVPGIYRVVDVFNQTHPNICVDFVTKVGGSGEYIPLLNALKAHSSDRTGSGQDSAPGGTGRRNFLSKTFTRDFGMLPGRRTFRQRGHRYHFGSLRP
jgi:hypothetical protein